jgi:hypothetical protein
VPSCRSISEVDEVCEWLFLQVGTDLTKDRNRDVSENEARDIAELALGRDLEALRCQVREWWEFHPWTVTRIVRRSVSVGATISLPLSPKAFEEYRAGRLRDRDLGSDHLSAPSRHIVQFGIADSPRARQRMLAARRTAIKLFVLYWQLGELSGEIGDEVPDDSLQLLTLAPFEELGTMLKRVGWMPTGTHTPGLNTPLYQMELPARGKTLPGATFANNLQRWALDGVVGAVRRRSG